MSTKIEWVKNPDGTLGETWNPVRGCSRVSPGCQECYAERLAQRFCANGETDQSGEVVLSAGPFAGFVTKNGWTGRVELIEEKLNDPLHWRKPKTIFVNSMSDLHHERLPDEGRDRIYAVMARCPKHRFLVLTKRAQEMREYWNAKHQHFALEYRMGRSVSRILPIENLGLGVSVEDRKRLDRIDELRQTPAAMRFLSLEPLLEDLGTLNLEGIDWVIAGCESGPNRRGSNERWYRTIRDGCGLAGIPFFLKQMDLGKSVVKMPLLDGRIWDELPKFLEAKP